jgi:hypothetical protein
MTALPSERLLSGTEGPDVGDEGFALNRNILRHFGGSKLSVKEFTTTVCAKHEGMQNVLMIF